MKETEIFLIRSELELPQKTTPPDGTDTKDPTVVQEENHVVEKHHSNGTTLDTYSFRHLPQPQGPFPLTKLTLGVSVPSPLRTLCLLVVG